MSTAATTPRNVVSCLNIFLCSKTIRWCVNGGNIPDVSLLGMKYYLGTSGCVSRAGAGRVRCRCRDVFVSSLQNAHQRPPVPRLRSGPATSQRPAWQRGGVAAAGRRGGSGLPFAPLRGTLLRTFYRFISASRPALCLHHPPHALQHIIVIVVDKFSSGNLHDLNVSISESLLG